ncbi:MAG TPA: response regulator [Chloroflexota bacterium]|nr:response regulator [Chloroflexota bacterium]
MVSNPDAMTTVLVVEDDPTVAELVRAVINDVPGWGAIVAYDAPSAATLLEHVRADVLVVDVMLPGTTGIELLAGLRTRANWHEPPVIVMSANVSSQAVERALGYDPSIQFLAKPFDIDDMVMSITRALEARRVTQETEDRSEGQPDQPRARQSQEARAS